MNLLPFPLARFRAPELAICPAGKIQTDTMTTTHVHSTPRLIVALLGAAGLTGVAAAQTAPADPSGITLTRPRHWRKRSRSRASMKT